MSFVVKREVNGKWVPVWKDENGNPKTFDTEDQANAEIISAIADDEDAQTFSHDFIVVQEG